MAKITPWEPRFSVGQAVFDEHHRELLGLCQQAADCLEADAFQATVQFHTILHDLIGYTTRHFRAEEKLLRDNHFPLFEEHRAEHVEYELRLTEFLLEANCGTIDKQRLHRYLSDWWTHHILESDMRYSLFLKGIAQQ